MGNSLVLPPATASHSAADTDPPYSSCSGHLLSTGRCWTCSAWLLLRSRVSRTLPSSTARAYCRLQCHGV